MHVAERRVGERIRQAVGIIAATSGTQAGGNARRTAREMRTDSLPNGSGSPHFYTPGKTSETRGQNKIFSRPPRDCCCNIDCVIDTIDALIRAGRRATLAGRMRSSGGSRRPTIEEVIAPRRAQDFLELGAEDCYTAGTHPGRNLKFPVLVSAARWSPAVLLGLGT